MPAAFLLDSRSSEDAAVAWVQAAGRELAGQPERLRAQLGLTLGLLREQTAASGDPDPLERLLPALRHALESLVYHVPDSIEMPGDSSTKIPRWARVAVEGQVFEPAVERREGQTLTVGKDGQITWKTP